MTKKDSDDPTQFARSVLDQIIAKHDPEAIAETGKDLGAQKVDFELVKSTPIILSPIRGTLRLNALVLRRCESMAGPIWTR
jgi:hypothetical protein